MKKSFCLVVFISISFFSCNPRPASFRYFKESSKVNSWITKPAISKVYLSKNEKRYNHALRFYDKGIVKSLSTPSNYIPPLSEFELSKTDFGYYKVEEDSIFFDLKAFYDKRPIEFYGKMYKDSIVFIVYSNRTNIKSKQTYKLVK